MNINSISNIYRKNTAATTVAAKAGGKASAVSEHRQSPNEDKVLFSSNAPAGMPELYTASATAAKEVASTDNSSKVADLKARVASGSYNVPADDIAEKMMSAFISAE